MAIVELHLNINKSDMVAASLSFISCSGEGGGCSLKNLIFRGEELISSQRVRIREGKRETIFR